MAKVRVEVEKYVKVTVDVDVPEAEEIITAVIETVQEGLEADDGMGS